MNFLIETITIPVDIQKVRLSELDPSLFQSIQTKSALKKAIKSELVELNGEFGSTGDFVSNGDTVRVYQNHEQKEKAQIEHSLKILYEDKFLAVIVKPAGMLVSGNKRMTVENALKHNLSPSHEEDALTFPEPIHRLDFATSGALLVGKTRGAVVALNQLFEERRIKKKYLAVCIGDLPKEGDIKTPIDGKEAMSSFRLLATRQHGTFNKLNLLEVTIHTGRRNQIRLHLAGIGNPIYGDQKFSPEDIHFRNLGLFLHAHSLGFKHPLTGKEIAVEAGAPKKFKRLFRSYFGNAN